MQLSVFRNRLLIVPNKSGEVDAVPSFMLREAETSSRRTARQEADPGAKRCLSLAVRDLTQ